MMAFRFCSFKAFPLRFVVKFLCCGVGVVLCSFTLLLLNHSSVHRLASFPDLYAGDIQLHSDCMVSMVLEERGSRLSHSWTDQELFDRVLKAERQLPHVEAGGGGGGEEGAGGLNYSDIAGRSVGRGEEGAGGLHYSDIAGRSIGELLRGCLYNPSWSAAFKSSTKRRASCLGRAARLHSSKQPLDANHRPKIAFLFLTRGALPFAPLWNRFFRGHEHLYNIYVHMDPFRVGVFDRKTYGVFWGRLIPPDQTRRGTPSLAAAQRRLLANALLDDPLNRYFAVVSEHCIPLRGFKSVYARLTGSERSFIEILKEAPTLYSRYVARGSEAVMLPEVPLSSFRVGSQFFVLTRKHAILVVADTKLWSKFRLPCVSAHTCYAEEHYFPTLIDMADPGGSTGFTLTYVDWSHNAGGHPRTFRKEEVERELIRSLRRRDSFLFARKFADDCLDNLLRLSPLILEKGPHLD